ncbi:hypothetical protein HZB02_03495 [Candidatus Woesearchaeota archaeon]|nr:hypothetical protein [Candidatus Woesearchaeota archaeon]
MKENEFLERLFDGKLVRLITLFIQQPGKQFYLKELADHTRVSTATTHRNLRKLVRMSIIQEIWISKFRVYQLKETEETEFLSRFIKPSTKVLDEFVAQVSSLPGVEAVVLHGRELDNKANLLIIGKDVDGEKVKLVAAEVRDKFSYTLTYLILTREQYQQMADMGLYSGKKKVLYDKSGTFIGGM